MTIYTPIDKTPVVKLEVQEELSRQRREVEQDRQLNDTETI